MPARKGNKNALGNKGGRPSKYKPEYAETARKLYAQCGYTDLQLAKWFEVNVDTIYHWKLRHPEFAEALKVGKAEQEIRMRGMKWLAARRPERYRQRKEDKRVLSMDDAFLKFLEQMDEEKKRENALLAPRACDRTEGRERKRDSGGGGETG
jgi:uncharacterized protein YjcR